jgi:uncharacterized protein
MIFSQLVVADSFAKRARGLMFRKHINFEEAMYFPRCSSVHTLGMRIPIDIVFVTSQGRISRICEAVPPFRIRWSSNAFGVLEMAAGAARQRGFKTQMKVI